MLGVFQTQRGGLSEETDPVQQSIGDEVAKPACYMMAGLTGDVVKAKQRCNISCKQLTEGVEIQVSFVCPVDELLDEDIFVVVLVLAST